MVWFLDTRRVNAERIWKEGTNVRGEWTLCMVHCAHVDRSLSMITPTSSKAAGYYMILRKTYDIILRLEIWIFWIYYSNLFDFINLLLVKSVKKLLFLFFWWNCTLRYSIKLYPWHLIAKMFTIFYDSIWLLEWHNFLTVKRIEHDTCLHWIFESQSITNCLPNSILSSRMR